MSKPSVGASPAAKGSNGKEAALVIPSAALKDEALYQELLSVGMSAQAEGERASRGDRESVDAVAAIVLLWTMELGLALRLVAGGLSELFVGVGVALAEELDKHLGESPPDFRRFEWVTPEHRRLVEEGASALSLVKQSATDAARAMRDVTSVNILGRGLEFARDNPSEVRDAIQHFIAGAKEREGLLAMAGITAATMDELRAHQKTLDGVVSQKVAREQAVAWRVERIYGLALALESFFHLYRARVRTAVGRDPEAFGKALAAVPRARERRTRAAPERPVTIVAPGAVVAQVAPVGGDTLPTSESPKG